MAGDVAIGNPGRSGQEPEVGVLDGFQDRQDGQSWTSRSMANKSQNGSGMAVVSSAGEGAIEPVVAGAGNDQTQANEQVSRERVDLMRISKTRRPVRDSGEQHPDHRQGRKYGRRPSNRYRVLELAMTCGVTIE